MAFSAPLCGNSASVCFAAAAVVPPCAADVGAVLREIFADTTVGKDRLKTAFFEPLEVKTGLHGGTVVTVHSKSAPHYLKKITTDEGGDVVINLALYPTILGEKEAQYFGFSQKSATTFEIPLQAETSPAIKKFNSSLPIDSPYRIAIDTYPSVATFEGHENYLKTFARTGKKPASLNGHQAYHDSSVHLLEGFFANNEIVARMQESIELWFAFKDFLYSKNIKLNDKEALRHMSTWVDSTFANLQGLFIGRDDLNKLRIINANAIQENLFNSGASGMVHDFAKTGTVPFPEIEDIANPLVTGNYTRAFRSRLPDAETEAYFDAFIESYKIKRPQAFKPLSFDIAADLNGIRKLMNKKGRLNIKDYEQFAISKPFAERMKHLKKLVKVF